MTLPMGEARLTPRDSNEVLSPNERKQARLPSALLYPAGALRMSHGQALQAIELLSHSRRRHRGATASGQRPSLSRTEAQERHESLQGSRRHWLPGRVRLDPPSVSASFHKQC